MLPILGEAEDTKLSWYSPPKLEEWSDWSDCSKSCSHEDDLGSRTRSRKCQEGLNSDQNCLVICKNCDKNTKIGK